MSLQKAIGITGGTGLVGKALRSKLSSPVVLNLRHPSVNIKTHESVVFGNFADPNVFEKFVSKIDILIHAATGVGPRSGFEEQFIRDDLVGTIKLAKAFFKENPSGHFIYLSTAGGLYDLGDPSIKTEESEVVPSNFYGAIKLLIEDSLERLGGKVTILRPCPVYGDSFKKNQTIGLIDKLLKSMIADQAVPIFDKLESARDYLHVDDLANAIIILMNRNVGNVFEIYNIGTGQETSISNVITLINSLGVEKVKVEILPTPNLRTSLIVNSEKVFRDVGWEPAISLKDGINQMYQNLKKGK